MANMRNIHEGNIDPTALLEVFQRDPVGMNQDIKKSLDTKNVSASLKNINAIIHAMAKITLGDEVLPQNISKNINENCLKSIMQVFSQEFEANPNKFPPLVHVELSDLMILHEKAILLGESDFKDYMKTSMVNMLFLNLGSWDVRNVFLDIQDFNLYDNLDLSLSKTLFDQKIKVFIETLNLICAVGDDKKNSEVIVRKKINAYMKRLFEAPADFRKSVLGNKDVILTASSLKLLEPVYVKDLFTELSAVSPQSSHIHSNIEILRKQYCDNLARKLAKDVGRKWVFGNDLDMINNDKLLRPDEIIQIYEAAKMYLQDQPNALERLDKHFIRVFGEDFFDLPDFNQLVETSNDSRSGTPVFNWGDEPVRGRNLADSVGVVDLAVSVGVVDLADSVGEVDLSDADDDTLIVGENSDDDDDVSEDGTLILGEVDSEDEDELDEFLNGGFSKK